MRLSLFKDLFTASIILYLHWKPLKLVKYKYFFILLILVGGVG